MGNQWITLEAAERMACVKKLPRQAHPVCGGALDVPHDSVRTYRQWCENPHRWKHICLVDGAFWTLNASFSARTRSAVTFNKSQGLAAANRATKSEV